MSSSAIKSRPAYREIEWDRSGRQHVLLAAAEERAVADRLLGNLPAGPVTLIHLGGEPGERASAWTRSAPCTVTRRTVRSLPDALDALRLALGAAHMGARLYLIGPEDVIWQASQVAESLGMGRDEVHFMQAGTRARPVYCVHCRAITREVRTNVVTCDGCGRPLFVRDHFSRRLGAYMGFQVDAETPGEVPPMEEVFP